MISFLRAALIGLCLLMENVVGGVPLPTDSLGLLTGGVTIASNHLFNEGPLDLSGPWEFYFDQLLSPVKLKNAPQPEFMVVPGSWHRYGNYPTLGVATYHKVILIPENERDLSLYFPIINAAARIWVNGELQVETGIVSKDPARYRARLASSIVALPVHTGRIEITVEVANYSYSSGGIGASPLIDRTAALVERINSTNGIENFFSGSLVAMFLYQLILFFLFDRGKPYLWLSLICLGVALRALIVHGGSFLLPNLFPHVPWEIWKKLEFGSVYAIVALFPLYIYHLFPEQSPRKILYGFVSLSGLLVTSVVVTSQPTYGLLLDVCHVGLLLGFVYAGYGIINAWRAGNTDARTILFGVLSCFPFILLEILKNSLLVFMDIRFIYLVEVGVLIFLLFQVYLLANHYAKSYRELAVSYQGLERIVSERTTELTAANTVKNRLLSVMSHDVKSPLNSLRDILYMYNKGDIQQVEFQAFVKKLESDLVKTSVLVDNVLFWTSRQLKGVSLKIERFDLHELIEENLFLFQTLAANKHITIHHDSPRLLLIKSDKSILNFVMRNLLSNAIKFSRNVGKVEIQVLQEDGSVTVQVKDHGVGMDEQTLRALLTSSSQGSTSGTGNEKGTGLGLALCREYLLMAGGQLSVESTEGAGSTFSFTLRQN